MIRRTSTILLVSLLLVALLAMTAFAAKVNEKGKYGRAMIGKIEANRSVAYSFADESIKTDASAYAKGRVPLGTVAASASASPGLTFGWTWYDQQHNCSMGRMIETGPHTGETGTDRIVHMGFMYLPSGDLSDTRNYAYAAYNSDDASLVGPIEIDGPGSRGGYVQVDVTPDNRGIVGGHYYDSTTIDIYGYGNYQPCFFFDGGPAYATFPNYARVPDSVGAYDQTTTTESDWPKFFFQFGTDTVLHVFSMCYEANAADPSALMYHRKVGFEGGPSEWVYPPYVVDTVEDIAQDIIGQRNGDRVVMTWFATLPYQEPLCDTCSGSSAYNDGYSQMDNDIYFQESYDQGLTWEPRVNITKAPIGEACYKAYCDASALYDAAGNLHVVWHAVPWPADLCIEDGGHCWAENWVPVNARLMHWSENVPYIRPIADQVYAVDDPVWDSCWAGVWNLMISKPALSECNGNLYATWIQTNDGRQGIIDDCADWAWKKSPEGAANGDIWVSVSEDWGMTWDYQRNLTNTYTPHCDPKKGTDCASEHWASMSRTGWPTLAGENWAGAEIVDPSEGAYTGNWYLDIQYVEDRDAGIIVQSEGTWTNNPMNWFRLPCVDPVPAPIFTSKWSYLGDPTYVKPGEFLDTTLQIENIGNTTLTYTVTVDETPSAIAPGWLGVTNFSGSLPSGLAGIEVGDIRLNVNQETTTGNYFATITFEGNDDKNMPAVVDVEMIIADTIVGPSYGVVNNSCLALSVSNFGNIGRNGTGKVNMDYYPDDCDTTATVWLYDGSPLIGRIFPGDDTTFNWAIWGASYYSEYGLRPQGGQRDTKTCSIGAEVYQSGTFTTQDSALGMQQVWVAPADECNFVIEYLKMWSFDGAAHDDVMIGQGMDWDIPTDYKLEDTGQDMTATNAGAVDGPRGLVYLQGLEEEFPGDDTTYPYNCTDNSMRFGGNAFVESYLNDVQYATAPYGGFAGENDSLQDANGFYHGPLYYEMAVSGLTGTDSLEDLHTVLTFEKDLDFAADDVYEAVTILATIENGTLADFQAVIDNGKAWYAANGGMTMFDDLVDGDGNAIPNGIIDVCEGCCSEMGIFFQDHVGFNIVDVNDFVAWLWRGGDIYDCLEEVDVDKDDAPTIQDVNMMVAFLFRGGPGLGECP